MYVDVFFYFVLFFNIISMKWYSENSILSIQEYENQRTLWDPMMMIFIFQN